MIPEVGHALLIAATLSALICFILPLIGWRLNDRRLTQSAPMLSLLQLVFVTTSFALLITSYVTSDFSVLNVWQNSHSDQPLLFKFTSAWGNHEGSMLLWVWILTIFGGGLGLFGRRLPTDLRAVTLSIQSLMVFIFGCFVLMTSNPFTRLFPTPPEGSDLNPILQDIGLAIHPPLLYIGYVGFSMTFTFAAAALLIGRVDQAWARWVRPWTLLAWIFLTLGIAMGSYWAYYELGWGGWWFWDPVENASLLPWLSGTALLHSAIVSEKRGGLRIWTLLLAILTFCLSLLGTFLVRSGIITSVHSFATDPQRGLVILAILAFFIGTSLSLFALRAPRLKAGRLFDPISREGALVFNNIFLCASCATVLFGTLYPVFHEAFTGQKISVGAPFFNRTMVPLFLILVIALPFGPFMNWKRADGRALFQRLAGIAALAAIIAFLVYILTSDRPRLAPLGIGVAAWLILGSIYEPLSRYKVLAAKSGEHLKQLRRITRSHWGMTLGHLGMGITILGIVAVTGWESEKSALMKPTDQIAINDYILRFEGVQNIQGPNFTEDRGIFALLKDEGLVTSFTPSKRFYPARQMPTTEASLHTQGISQLYLSLGEVRDSGEIVVRFYQKPLILLIWFGAIIMALGGCLSLSDRALWARKTNKKRS
ncbi:MAG: heme lyase CcmF/NrfE family subunit [Maricaulaceae bacterium]